LFEGNDMTSMSELAHVSKPSSVEEAFPLGLFSTFILKESNLF